jgi:Icc-related predicted phosphoesterase
MKFLLHSDTHTNHRGVRTNSSWVPDVIIGAGDITGRGAPYQIQDYIYWLESQPHNICCIFIAGNHDISFDSERSDGLSYQLTNDIKRNLDSNDRIHYLENNSITIDGIKIWGSPVSPWFFGEYWAFNKHRGDEIKAVWDTIPEDTEIIIVHGPPHGYGDLLEEGERVGSKELSERIKSLPNLKMVVSGHIHEGYGTDTDERGILYVNASVLNRHYQLVNQPVAVEKIDNFYKVIEVPPLKTPIYE